MSFTLNYLHICDQIIVAQGTNNVSLINIFNEIRSKNFPAIHPRFSIISNTFGPKGNFKQEIEIIGPDGNSVAVTQGEIEFSGIGPNNFITNFINFLFEKPGEYSIRVKINGSVVKENAALISVKPV